MSTFKECSLEQVYLQLSPSVSLSLTGNLSKAYSVKGVVMDQSALFKTSAGVCLLTHTIIEWLMINLSLKPVPLAIAIAIEKSHFS